MTFLEQLEKFLLPLKRRIQLLVGRGTILQTNDSRKIQTVQASLLKGEIRDALERFQEYGFTSRPKSGAEAIVLFLNGERDHGVVIGVEDRRYRVKSLAEGEVAIYTDEGDKIHFKRGRIVELTTQTLKINASTKVEITSPLVTASGLMQVTGNVESAAKVTAAANVEAGANVVATAQVQAVSVAASGAVSGASVADATTTISALKAAYNSHKHSETGSLTGTTNAPV